MTFFTAVTPLEKHTVQIYHNIHAGIHIGRKIIGTRQFMVLDKSDIVLWLGAIQLVDHTCFAVHVVDGRFGGEGRLW